ncbi:MAG: DUF973 family protein [Pyrobaculum sp.]|jgi:hypothetical protein
MEMRNVEISALRTLRSGFLYVLVAVIVGVVAALAGLLSIIAALGYRPAGSGFFYLLVAVIVGAALGCTPAAPHGPSAFAGVVGAVVLLLVPSLVIVLYAIFGKIRPGMRQLSEVDSVFRICYTGTTLMLVGLAILVLGLIVLAAVFAAASFSPEALRGTVVSGLILALGVLLIGGIIAFFIGDILTFVVGAFKLHGKYQNSLYMAAGILFVVDIALLLVGVSGILTLVGYILMYIALGDTISRLSTATATPTQA